MIASLTGRLILKAPTQVVVDVQGVGYELFVPLSTYDALPSLNETTRLCVHTHLRDDAIQLYGFHTDGEKTAFLMLTTVTGIGPKLALSVLSTFSCSDLLSAVQAGDVEKLASVPGIGKKSASRLVLELKDRVERLQKGGALSAEEPGSQKDGVYEDALSALLNLGYRAGDAKAVLKRVSCEEGALKDIIRTALQELAKG